MSKFEVGKKYSIGDSKTYVTCVGHKTNGVALIELSHGYVVPVENPENWIEYKEPVTIKGWVCVFKDLSGNNPRLGMCVYPTKEEAMKYIRSSLDGVMEITYESL